MPKLIDMAKTKAEKKKETEPYAELPRDVPDYPYGLTIHIHNDQIDKLGIADCEADDMVLLVAKCMVSEASTITTNGKKKRNLTLQLQKMNVSKEADETDAETELYE